MNLDNNIKSFLPPNITQNLNDNSAEIKTDNKSIHQDATPDTTNVPTTANKVAGKNPDSSFLIDAIMLIDKQKATNNSSSQATSNNRRYSPLTKKQMVKMKEVWQLARIEARKANTPGTDSSMTTNDVMNLISPEEQKLIKDNNLDLTEKLENGYPRYIFAKGLQDGKYHVYDMGSEGYGRYVFSIARLYGKKTVESAGHYQQQGGFDICPNGNGWITSWNNFEFSDDKCCNNNNTVYFFDNCSNVKQLNNCNYATSTPISLDLNGDGVKTSDKEIMYDIDGDGILDKINDSADGVLVFDADGDGVSGEDAKECFGNNTDLDGNGKADGFSNGFQALKALAEKAGLIDGINDNKLDADDIRVLESKYGFKIKIDGYNGEGISLLDLGITEINLATTDKTTMNRNFDGNGNDLMTQEGATFIKDGEELEYADIWHRKLK